MPASISIQQAYDGRTWIIRWPDGRRSSTEFGPAWVAANAWGSKHGGMVYALDVRGQVIKAAEWAHPDGEGDHFVKRDLEPSLIAL
jgi:hypothetical protein